MFTCRAELILKLIFSLNKLAINYIRSNGKIGGPNLFCIDGEPSIAITVRLVLLIFKKMKTWCRLTRTIFVRAFMMATESNKIDLRLRKK